MLIDTQALIWFGADHPRLSRRASAAISEPGNQYSIATIWEAAIKSGLGKLDLFRGTRRITAKEYFQWMAEALELTTLSISQADAEAVESLPPHHNDPFDRMLIAQALARDLAVVSADAVLDKYGVRRVW